jgi:hypothetical protein
LCGEHRLSGPALERCKTKDFILVDLKDELNGPFTEIANAIEKYDGSVVQFI